MTHVPPNSAQQDRWATHRRHLELYPVHSNRLQYQMVDGGDEGAREDCEACRFELQIDTVWTSMSDGPA